MKQEVIPQFSNTFKKEWFKAFPCSNIEVNRKMTVLFAIYKKREPVIVYATQQFYNICPEETVSGYKYYYQNPFSSVCYYQYNLDSFEEISLTKWIWIVFTRSLWLIIKFYFKRGIPLLLQGRLRFKSK